MTEPRIYIACLAAYNNGILHGAWIDPTLELDNLRDTVNAMLKASPIEGAEEFAIHDYEGFAGCNINEYEGLESVHNLAIFVEEHGELSGAVLDHYCNDLEEAQKALDENYYGCFTLRYGPTMHLGIGLKIVNLRNNELKRGWQADRQVLGRP